ENVIARAKESGHRPRGVEGLNSGEWVLVDLVDVVVHVMQAQTRLFYQIEKLWDLPPPEAGKKPASKPKRKPKTKTKAKTKGKIKVKAKKRR
ncbi:MAG: ribosome silencing factor, partial [Hydrocarboniphaga effusa]|nr:ribosome silencing factor [Hydrocarboniphaga effusa]